jgi:hypothetical protein
MVTVVVAVVIEILNEFSRFFVYIEIQLAFVIPGYFHVKVWKGSLTVNIHAVECPNPFNCYFRIRERL